MVPAQVYAKFTPVQEKAAYFCLLFSIIYSIVYSNVMVVYAQVLGVGDCKKTPEAVPTSDRASSSQVQD